MQQRLISYWVYGGFLSSFLLLGLIPLIARGGDLLLTLVYLQLPIYMLHQLEEHDHDRLRLFVNQVIGDGRELLSQTAVFVINVPGVWGVNLFSILMAYGLGLGYGLIGIYLTLINALVHIAQALHLKSYNPGLITALFLFLPVGTLALWKIMQSGRVTLPYHLLGLGVALTIHLLIVAFVLIQSRKASVSAPSVN